MLYDFGFSNEQIQDLKQRIENYSWFEQVKMDATNWHDEKMVIYIKDPKGFFCSDFDFFQTLKDSKIPIVVKCDGREIYIKE